MWPYLKKWYIDNKYLFLVLFFATFLLFYRISYRTFWGDEMAVLDYLKQGPVEFLIKYWQAPDNHPPLYYFLVLIVSKILPGTELTVRFVSAVSGLGIVYLVYLFTFRIIGNRRIALLVAFFTTLSSYFILISQMARYHSLAGLLSLLVLYLFYVLYFEGYTKKVWCLFLVSLVAIGYADYLHFFYNIFIINLVYLYTFIKSKPILPFLKWFIGQLIVAFFLSPLIWIIYHRVIIQGDGGWEKTNLLVNSWRHIILAIFFHIYSFLFGENIFPWDYTFFILGVTVLLVVLFGFIKGFCNKTWSSKELFIILLSVGLIVLNTFFMNVANPRYNFIVYPKFVFVAYPLWIITMVLVLNKLGGKVRAVIFLCWAIVSIFGLWNFYQAKNYLNPSYFRTFESFKYVQTHSQVGHYLAITPYAGQGFYDFYKDNYFKNLIPVSLQEIAKLPDSAKLWFFSAASEASDASVGTEDLLPPKYKVLDRFDSVQLDPTFKKTKELFLDRPSYIYKYTLFLLEKI